MIVLDTNVLSETLKPLPNAAVVARMAAQPRSTLFTTTVVEAEILYGVAVNAVLAVAHRPFCVWTSADWQTLFAENTVVIDVQGVVPRQERSEVGVRIWKL